MNILFVCTGNTCRSSMAEGIFKNMLKNNNIDNINVSSAGISAFEGDRANEKAINVLKKHDIDISNHRARQLTNSIIKSSDLILAMTDGHKRSIQKYSPESSNKVFTLKEYAGKSIGENMDNMNLNIDDPYGMDYYVYEFVMEEIKNEIEKIIRTIDRQ